MNIHFLSFQRLQASPRLTSRLLASSPPRPLAPPAVRSLASRGVSARRGVFVSAERLHEARVLPRDGSLDDAVRVPLAVDPQLRLLCHFVHPGADPAQQVKTWLDRRCVGTTVPLAFRPLASRGLGFGVQSLCAACLGRSLHDA